MGVGGHAGGGVLWQPRIRKLYKGVGEVFEEDIILQEFISLVGHLSPLQLAGLKWNTWA